MKFIREISHVYPLLGLFVLLSLLAGCTKAVPDHSATAKMTKYDNLSAMEYCEVFLIGGNPITKLQLRSVGSIRPKPEASKSPGSY
jgi:hypothetical protein